MIQTYLTSRTLQEALWALQSLPPHLTAVHSSVEQTNYSQHGRYGRTVRRELVQHIHPIVRRHPVTGEEALYVNRRYTRRIVGLKVEESGE